jgi:uncharacterized membrane protein
MGPKILQVPLLTLAYLGIGYVAWVLAVVIAGKRAVAVPFVATGTMVAWDLAMHLDWSTLDRTWVWKEGEACFGVPVSNFVGWAGMAICYYGAFVLYCRARRRAVVKERGFWIRRF